MNDPAARERVQRLDHLVAERLEGLVQGADGLGVEGVLLRGAVHHHGDAPGLGPGGGQGCQNAAVPVDPVQITDHDDERAAHGAGGARPAGR